MGKIKEEEFLKEFMNHLKDLVKEAPYVIFIFISPILLIIVLAWGQEYIKLFFAFFLYSIFGIVWRHFIKDIRGRLKDSFPEKFTKINLWLTWIYQLVNLAVVVVFVMLMARVYLTK